MSKQYVQQIKLRTCHCDMYGNWLPSSIMDTMQVTTGEHCTALGLGKKQMDAFNLAWVLSRTKVQMNRLPTHGDLISAETYPTPCRHMLYPRANIFRDARGEEIGYASSLWVLVDKNARIVTQSSEAHSRIPDVAIYTAR